MTNLINKILWELMVNGVASWRVTPYIIRFMIYRCFGIQSDTRSIKGNCYFQYDSSVTIGCGSFINTRCCFHGPVTIGSNTWIAMDALFAARTHEIGSSEKRAGKNKVLPIKIGSGCWIGARVVILPGIAVNDGCIIGAGSVVTSDCESNCLYAGNPAKKIRELDV